MGTQPNIAQAIRDRGADSDDQMRARTGHAGHNFAVLRHIALNLIRLAPVQRKGGIKIRRLIAASI